MGIARDLFKLAERTTGELFVSVLIKIIIIAIYAWLLSALSPIEVLSWQFGLLLASAVIVWFFEFEGGFISEIVISRFRNRQLERGSESRENAQE